MTKLTFDLESRSEADLKKGGMYRYAEHPSTDIMCFAFKVNESLPVVWIPEKFRDLYDGEVISAEEVVSMIMDADIIEAHNAGFEAVMWKEIMLARYNFPPLAQWKLRCSAAKAAAHALPRALGLACEALGLSIGKDQTGYKIMMKMCRPRKPTKKDPSKWNEDPADFKLLVEYCKQDTEAEHELSGSLYDLSDSEQEVWQLDHTINNRGVRVDVPAIDSLISKVQEKENSLLNEIQQITIGKITSVRQIAATLEWLAGKGVTLKDLTKESVSEALDRAIPGNVRRLLEIRQSLGKSSVSKLSKMKGMACKDEKVRGSLLYHGASTGRWAGKGIQPQNYPREAYDAWDIDNIVVLDNDLIELLYDCPIQTASKCLRGMITATPGKKLFCADYSAIEARVLAWLANEDRLITAYEKGEDIYKLNAMDIYGCKYEDVDKERRQIGKVAELALGYQGWIGAFHSMSKNYGVKVSDERAKEIVISWRESRPNTVAYWKGVDTAAMQAVKTGNQYSYGKVKFGIRGKFLHCRLPSGRLLSYYDPAPMWTTTKYGVEKEVVSFMGVDSKTKKWTRQTTYGGKLTENICQSVARDLLVYGMQKAEGAGYPIVMHVHDECMAEKPEGEGDLEQFENLMSEKPAWADGCPVRAEGWVGFRYRK